MFNILTVTLAFDPSNVFMFLPSYFQWLLVPACFPPLSAQTTHKLCNAGPPVDARDIAGRARGLHWYALLYCGAAGFDCKTCVKIGGRYEDIAYPNFQSAINGNKYSYVYAVQTAASHLAEKNTGSKVPLAKHIHFELPLISTCEADHQHARSTLNLRDSFQPSRMRKGDVRQLELLQPDSHGPMRPSEVVTAIQAMPHAEGLNAGPAANQSNKLSTWQSGSKARNSGPKQSQAAAMQDFKIGLDMALETSNQQAGLSAMVSFSGRLQQWSGFELHVHTRWPCIYNVMLMVSPHHLYS